MHRLLWEAQASTRGVTEEVYTRAVAVLPAYARGVAGELREASGRTGLWQEPPSDSDLLPGYSIERAQAASAAQAALDAAKLDAVLCKALKACGPLANTAGFHVMCVTGYLATP